MVSARGEVELGFQQVSELLQVSGIDFVAPLQTEIQKTTMLSACSSKSAKEPQAAQALIKFLSSPAAATAVINSGLEPVHGK